MFQDSEHIATDHETEIYCTLATSFLFWSLNFHRGADCIDMETSGIRDSFQGDVSLDELHRIISQANGFCLSKLFS